jgi:hypothetical protein
MLTIDVDVNTSSYQISKNVDVDAQHFQLLQMSISSIMLETSIVDPSIHT